MIKGSCLCKAVTYTLDEELSEIVFCHCSFCRKATASAYTVNAKVSSKNLALYGKREFGYLQFISRETTLLLPELS